MATQADETPRDKGLDETQRLLDEMDAAIKRTRLIIDGKPVSTPPTEKDDGKKE